MSWNEVKSKNEADYLNDIFGIFHDSLLKEICFDLGDYIQENFTMNAMEGVACARFLFQRIYKEPSVIEIEFRDVIQINIQPEDIRCILEARLHFQNDIFYWNSFDCPYENPDKEYNTWITAKGVSWRVRDELLGAKKIYGDTKDL